MRLTVRGGRERQRQLAFRALRYPWERLRGLLFTGPDAEQVALIGCASIHTLGMRYRLDVAFVARGGVVLEVWRSVPPGRFLGNSKAWVVLERPHSIGPWLSAGEVVEMELKKVGRPLVATRPQTGEATVEGEV